MGTRGLGNANLMTVINGKSVNHMNGNYDGDVFFVFALFGWICWEVQIEMM